MKSRENEKLWTWGTSFWQARGGCGVKHSPFFWKLMNSWHGDLSLLIIALLIIYPGLSTHLETWQLCFGTLMQNLWFLPEGPSGREKKRRVLRTTLGKCRGCRSDRIPLEALPNRESPWTATLKNDSFALEVSCLIATQINDYSSVNLRKPAKMTIVSCLKRAMKDSLNFHLKAQIHTNS